MFTDKIKEDQNKPAGNKSGTNKGSDFVKLTSEHPTIIRILDESPKEAWSHYVPKGHTAFPIANAGKGMSFICPGKAAGCPICKYNASLKDDEKKTKKIGSRKVYTFNVLERTPVVKCPQCETAHYAGPKGVYPEECFECGTSMVDVEQTPLNKIKVMQKGIMVTKQFISFEEEFGPAQEYDIKMDTHGVAEKASTTCVPKPASSINMTEAVGEDWQDKLYNIDDVIKPIDVENIERILNGEDFYSVFGK